MSDPVLVSDPEEHVSVLSEDDDPSSIADGLESDPDLLASSEEPRESTPGMAHCLLLLSGHLILLLQQLSTSTRANFRPQIRSRNRRLPRLVRYQRKIPQV